MKFDWINQNEAKCNASNQKTEIYFLTNQNEGVFTAESKWSFNVTILFKIFRTESKWLLKLKHHEVLLQNFEMIYIIDVRNFNVILKIMYNCVESVHVHVMFIKTHDRRCIYINNIHGTWHS